MRFLVLPRNVLIELREAGIDVDAIARKLVGKPASARMTPEEAESVLGEALGRIEDPAYGLTAGAKVRPELFGIAGLAAMAAQTFGDALARLARYKRMLWTDAIELVPAREGMRVRFHCSASDHVQHARIRADAELAFIVAFGRLLTRAPLLSPQEVRIRGPAPAHRAKYEAYFRCPVRFNQEIDEVTLSSLDLRRPLASCSPELSRLFDEQAEIQLAESGSEAIGERVKAALRRMVHGQPPRIGEVAKALGMSVRDVQRKLGEAGTSFAALLDETRRAIGRDLLVGTTMDVSEIALAVGFTSPGSFQRAFQRWEKTTPLAYRRASAKRQRRRA